MPRILYGIFAYDFQKTENGLEPDEETKRVFAGVAESISLCRESEDEIHIISSASYTRKDHDVPLGKVITDYLFEHFDHDFAGKTVKVVELGDDERLWTTLSELEVAFRVFDSIDADELLLATRPWHEEPRVRSLVKTKRPNIPLSYVWVNEAYRPHPLEDVKLIHNKVRIFAEWHGLGAAFSWINGFFTRNPNDPPSQ